jgi:endonuclease/exonuclease/phosphatase family metal-dependent hydrolase
MTLRLRDLRWLIAALWLVVPLVATAAAPSQPLRVMTFNVRLPLEQDGVNQWRFRRDFAAQVIARAKPDIVGTQELHKAQGDDLLARLPDYAWFGVDRRGGHGDEHMGIFYRHDRFRLVELGNFWLSDTPSVRGSISWGHPFPRMVTWGLFEEASGGRRFYMLNTHFPYRAEDGEARLKAARMIRDHIDTLPPGIPVILTGDFNTEPDSAVHALLTESLTDARDVAPLKTGPEATFHAYSGKGDRRIDWLLSRGFRAMRVQTLDDRRGPLFPSDHYPVVADFSWP